MKGSRNTNIIQLCATKIKLLLLFTVLVNPQTLVAQVKFSGVLQNMLDSTAVPYAAIHTIGTGVNTLTDVKGQFSIDVPADMSKLTLSISAIGCKTTVSYSRPFNKQQTIYIDLLPNTLADVAIKGMSAEDVVRAAVSAIPGNYADSPYFAYSLFRYYERVNGRCFNLIEAEPVVMFRLTANSREIAAKEAFAVKRVRRSHMYDFLHSGSNKQDLPAIMAENPVYHLNDGSLSPGKVNSYSFSFDTADRSADYVVNYYCRRFSCDAHGLEGSNKAFEGEAWDKGKLVIDRSTLAIKKFNRQTFRYPDYAYPRNNNFIVPDYKHVVELVSADLEVNYAQEGGKWYVKSIFHRYTNDFIGVKSSKKELTITDVYEWHSVAHTKVVTADVAAMFAAEEQSKKMRFTYDEDFWNQVTFPFHYDNGDSVYSDIAKKGPLREQFYAESKNVVY